jgi:hypothetical protein
MAGDNLGETIDNAHERFVYFFASATYGVKQSPVRSAFYTFFSSVTFHTFLLLCMDN